MAGFVDELVKTAGLGSMIESIKENPDVRSALLRSMGLGAATAAAGGVVKGGIKGKKLLRDVAAGAAAGGVSGLAYPSWFHSGLSGPK